MPPRSEHLRPALEDIRRHVALGEHLEGINRLLDITRDRDPSLRDDAILASGQFHDLEGRKRSGQVSSADAATEKAQIVKRVLSLVAQLERLAEASPRAPASSSARSPEEGAAGPPAAHAPPAGGPSAGPPLAASDRNDYRVAHAQYRQSRRAVGDPSVSVRCNNLRKRYRRASNFVLSEVSLELRPREILGIVGLNGSGKTTLLRIIAGHIRADEGVLEYPVLSAPGPDWRVLKNKSAYIP
jgi:ABC-type multidrug transport system fused ATPase/permease subunit